MLSPPFLSFQLFHLKMSGSLWNSASACPSSAPSSTAKCVERLPRTNCAATKGKKNKTPSIFKNFCLRHWEKCKDVYCSGERLQLCMLCFFSLQELLHSSRKLSLKVLSFVQSFQVTTLSEKKRNNNVQWKYQQSGISFYRLS